MQKPLTRPSATLPMNPWEHRTSNIQHPTPNRQSMVQLETIGCSMLVVGCWMFSFGSWVQCATFSGNSLPLHPPLRELSGRGGSLGGGEGQISLVRDQFVDVIIVLPGAYP